MKTSATRMRFRAYPTGVKLSLAVYVLAFLIGTSTHVDGLLHGWWFTGHPLLNAYWSSLVLLDPLAIVLLLRAPRAGLLLALAIMITDVGINSAATYIYIDAARPYGVDYFVQLQSAFLGFVLGSAPFLWPHLGRSAAARCASCGSA